MISQKAFTTYCHPNAIDTPSGAFLQTASTNSSCVSRVCGVKLLAIGSQRVISCDF